MRRLRSPRALAALFAALAPAAVDAQSVRVSVVDAESGAPVIGASATLLSEGRRVESTTTDADGRAELRTREGGTYVLAIGGLGYRDFASEPLTLAEDEFVEVRVRLGVQAIPLEPLVVVASGRTLSPAMAGFERRRADPSLGGAYLTRADIERRPVATPTELLFSLPSVSVQPIMTLDSPYAKERNLIWFPSSRGASVNPGACLAEVFVDGVRARQSAESSMDDLLAGADLAGVEVYPRPFTAPAEYRGTGGCGVVLFWTEPRDASDGVWSWKRLAVGGGLLGLLVGLAIAN